MIGRYRRWRRRQRWSASASEAQIRHIDGVGQLAIHPMTTAMYFTFRDVDLSDLANQLSLCAWVIVECVEEYSHLSAVGLASQLAPVSLLAVAGEIMVISGLTRGAQEAAEKKCEAGQT